MDDRFSFAREIDEHLVVVDAARSLEAPLRRLADLAVATIRAGGKLMLFGNGGSAADAQHIAAELVGRFQDEALALPAIALTTDSSILTSVGNDLGFEAIYSRQIRALGRPGDLAIGISTSGRSANVRHALSTALDCGLRAAAFSGGDGGSLPMIADPLLLVPSANTQRIQETHILLGHLLCAAIESSLTTGS